MASSPETPLSGRRVLVTRAAGQSVALVERLRVLGAQVVEVALVRISAPDDPGPLQAAMRSLDEYDWLLLTSANAVHAVADAAGPALPKDLRLASAGPATTDAIRSRFPGRALTAQATGAYGAEGLAHALALVKVADARMLFPVSDLSPASLAEALRKRGARVDVVVAYRTTVPEGAGDGLRAALTLGIDAVTFASPSAVEAFVGLGGGGAGVPAVVIGPSTAAVAAAAGFVMGGLAGEATTEGLAAAVEKYLAETPKTR